MLPKMKYISSTLFAYNSLREKILRNELNSDQYLKEDQFCEGLKLSRTPIREALIMLERENLITREERMGFRLRRFSLKEISDLYQFRELIELGMADQIMKRITDGDIENLTNTLGDIKRKIDGKNIGEAFSHGIEFHKQIIEISKNEICMSTLNNCYDKLIIISWGCKNIKMVNKSAQEHEKILTSLKARDQSGYRESISRHNASARERALNLLKTDMEKWFFVP